MASNQTLDETHLEQAEQNREYASTMSDQWSIVLPDLKETWLEHTDEFQQIKHEFIRTAPGVMAHGPPAIGLNEQRIIFRIVDGLLALPTISDEYKLQIQGLLPQRPLPHTLDCMKAAFYTVIHLLRLNMDKHDWETVLGAKSQFKLVEFYWHGIHGWRC